ncbi:enoyl-CoA hydratase/isomerase family protein [Paenibacillus senegalimassiliensis]|uniref:enoyl-CoA hydratase/isomerase family protein n=1 Tax=Paenibacillus senegalimassiliensis TaxID=1737426 RepID=UPI00073F8450|nr:enoyl-CoA hydratase/isomerase family protein [Paenibacillus senegalimassiliensis]
MKQMVEPLEDASDISSEIVRTRIAGSIFYIELNHPATRNSLEKEMATQLLQAIRAASANPKCAIIVFLSTLRSCFSVGPSLAGLTELSLHPQGAALLGDVVDVLNQIVMEIYHSPKLTVAGIHGCAYGGGLNIMLACDYRLAEEKTKLIENFHYMGFTPDLGASYFLPRCIGQSRCMDLLVTGRLFTAREVADWGLFHEVVEKRSGLLERIDALCSRFLTGEVRNVERMKELLHTSADTSLEEHLEKEKRYLTDCLRYPEITQRLKQVGI